MHIKKVVKLLSTILVFLALILLVPAALALIWGESEALKAFLLTIGIMAVFVFPAMISTKSASLATLSGRDGFLFTTLTWVFAAAFGALPFYFSGVLPNYSDAFFEVISGFTTTGSTRIDNVEGIWRSMLFWRSLTNWLGGMGIVVLFIAILPALGSSFGAFNLMGAETVGPVKSKLTPKTKHTAVILWVIYVGLTLLEILLLLLGGLSLFDSTLVAFSTLSTAGFCTKNASIGGFGSAYVEVVVTVFMILASVNFSLYFLLLKGKLKNVWRDTEFKVFVWIVLGTIGLCTLGLCVGEIYDSFSTALRHAAFQISSVISTTGFSTAQYMNWPAFSIFTMILTMFIGGCAGSTGGGVKVLRHYILFSHSRNIVLSKTHPNSVFTLTVNGEPVQQEMIDSIFTFFFLYIVTWISSAVVISICGVSIRDALSSTLLSIGNIGMGFGDVPFSAYPHWTNWIFSFLMLAGRLELTTVYVLFTRMFWKR